MQKDTFKTILLIWSAMLIMASIFAIISFVLASNASSDASLPRLPLAYIALFGLGTSIIGSHFMYRFLLGNVKKESAISGKKRAFFTACLIQGAILESGSILCSVVNLITNQPWLLIGSGVGILIMLLQLPTRQRCLADLELSLPELETWENS